MPRMRRAMAPMAEDTGETQWVHPRRPIARSRNRARGIALFSHVTKQPEAMPHGR